MSDQRNSAMSEEAWDPNGEARSALRRIVDAYGAQALSGAFLQNQLNDQLPSDAPTWQKSLLAAAAEAKVADDLREKVTQGIDPDTAVRLVARRFADAKALKLPECLWVTAEFARTLDYRVSDEVFERSEPPGLEEPGPAETVPRGDVHYDEQRLDPARTRSSRGPLIVGAGAVVVLVAVTAVVAGLAANHKWLFAVTTTTTTSSTSTTTTSTTTTSTTCPGCQHILALSTLLPRDTTDCQSIPDDKIPAGFVGWTATASCAAGNFPNLHIYGYQFDSNSDYLAAISRFNQDVNFNPIKTGTTCTSNQSGYLPWYSTTYPQVPGQIQECYQSSSNTPAYIWTVPTQNTILEAIGPEGSTISAVHDWWNNNGGPYNN